MLFTKNVRTNRNLSLKSHINEIIHIKCNTFIQKSQVCCSYKIYALFALIVVLVVLKPKDVSVRVFAMKPKPNFWFQVSVSDFETKKKQLVYAMNPKLKNT